MKKILFITIIIFIFIASLVVHNFFNKKPEEVEASANIRSGLVGYWKMDEASWNGTTGEVKDVIGTNNGTAVSGANTSPTAQYGRSGSFNNAASNYVTAGTTNLPTGTAARTMAFWFKWNAVSFGQEMVGYGNNVSGQRFAVILDTTLGGNVGIEIANEGMIWGWAGDTNWHHVATVLPPGSTSIASALLYVDGALKPTIHSGSVTMNTTGATLEFGRIPTFNGFYFNGRLDDIRIYNRALSAQEIALLYGSNRLNTPSRASSTPSGINSLVGYWTMDSGDVNSTTMYDRSGQNNHGTMTGTTAATGKINQARSFNGSTDYISAADSSSLKPAKTVTVSAWVKLNSLNTNAACGGAPATTQYILFKQNTRPGGQSEGYTLVDYNNAWYFGITNSAGTQDFAISTSTPKVGQWTHIVGVFNRPSMKIYINGRLEHATSHDFDIDYGATSLYIGRSGVSCAVGWDAYFNGAMDDTRVYNYALSAQEVSNLYNAAKVNYLSTVTTGLVSYWKLNEGGWASGVAGQVKDSTSNRHDGTSTNTVSTSTAKSGRAGYFAGNSTLNWPDSTDWDFGSGNFGVSMWFYPTVLSAQQILYVQHDTGPTYSPINLQSQSGTLYLYMSSSGSAWDVASANVVGTIAVNKWYHVVITRLGNSINYYFNGKLVGTISTAVALYNSPESLDIGSGKDTQFWNGVIDDVRIYKGRALSAADVALLYRMR